MVIISKWKDYYDYIAHRYGGGDPKVVYERGRIVPRAEYGEVTKIFEVDRMPFIDPIRWPPSNADYELAYAVVVGKAYLLSRSKDTFTDDVNTWRLIEPESLKRDKWRWRRHDFGAEFGKENPALIEMSRVVCHPVFVIKQISSRFKSEKYYVSIHGQCPVLKDLGFPAKIPAEQMYQELAYFMGNTIKPSPDVKPPVEVSNRDKILAAGFDLKQSFRHRM